MKFKNYLVSAVALLFAPPVFAVPDVPIQRITLNGMPYQIQAIPSGTKKVVFYAVTKGNSSQPLTVALTAPAGAKLTASMSIMKKDPLEQAAQGKGFFPVVLKTERQLSKESTCLDFAPGETSTQPPPIDRPESNSPLCDLFTEEEMTALAETLSAVYGGEWSRAQVCGYLVANYFGGMEDCDKNDPECIALAGQAALTYPFAKQSGVAQTQVAYGLLHENACAPKNSKYVVRFEVDLSKANLDGVDSIDVGLRAMEFSFTGSRAALIKPKSDGRYAPQPIVLMAFVGTMCGQKLSVAVWGRNGLKRLTQLKLGDLLPYKGKIFTRSPIGPVLKGGKGTFELYAPRAGYGVCFDLVPRRQAINGF